MGQKGGIAYVIAHRIALEGGCFSFDQFLPLFKLVSFVVCFCLCKLLKERKVAEGSKYKSNIKRQLSAVQITNQVWSWKVSPLIALASIFQLGFRAKTPHYKRR